MARSSVIMLCGDKEPKILLHRQAGRHRQTQAVTDKTDYIVKKPLLKRYDVNIKPNRLFLINPIQGGGEGGAKTPALHFLKTSWKLP